VRIGTWLCNRQSVRVLIHIYGGNIKLYLPCHDGIQGCGATPVLIHNVNVDGDECSASHPGDFVCSERVHSFFFVYFSFQFAVLH
jgi:hypothetical protein